MKIVSLAALLVFSFAEKATARVWKVSPGEKIQAAVERAKPGDTIEVFPGIYREAVVIDKPNITIQAQRSGTQDTILDGNNEKNDGFIVSGSGFRIEGFKIQNFKGNGIMTQGANDVVIKNNDIRYTGIYGIYPTRGKNILVEGNRAWGIADAAIYIGMCENVDVIGNETFANVAGIEAENSTNVLIEKNSAHNNTGGILIFNLPGLPVKHGENSIIRNNSIIANNFKNFGPKGSIVATVPQGSGIILLAADSVVIENNVIQDNQGAGIIIADHDYITDVAALDPQVEPNPDNNQILANEFSNNGARPKGMLRWALLLQYFSLRGKDILATGKGKNNCILENVTQSMKGTESFSKCATQSESTARSFYTSVASTPSAAEGDQGKFIYEAVCAGCHALGMQRVGPAIEEIQKKYANNPAGIVDFALAPKKIRPTFPVMPSQAYLGKEKLGAVAQYLLKVK